MKLHIDKQKKSYIIYLNNIKSLAISLLLNSKKRDNKRSRKRNLLTIYIQNKYSKLGT
jgi:hypothetical protein